MPSDVGGMRLPGRMSTSHATYQSARFSERGCGELAIHDVKLRSADWSSISFGYVARVARSAFGSCLKVRLMPCVCGISIRLPHSNSRLVRIWRCERLAGSRRFGRASDVHYPLRLRIHCHSTSPTATPQAKLTSVSVTSASSKERGNKSEIIPMTATTTDRPRSTRCIRRAIPLASFATAHAACACQRHVAG